MAKKKCCGGVTLGVGLLFVVLGVVVGWAIFPVLLKDMVHKEIDLTDKESMGYENFEAPMVPVLMKFTFWNIENPEEIEQGAKPKVTEIGPYVYQETRTKHDIKYLNDSQFINYGLYKQWDFVEDLSCKGCSKDDEVTILNMPLIGAVWLASEIGGFVGNGILNSINNAMQGKHVYGVPDGCCIDTLFVTKGVDDLLFGGIKDGIVKFLMESSATNSLLPPQINEETGFAIMNPRNATSDNEWYQIETGKVDWNRASMITKWGPKEGDLREDLESTKWWPVRGYKGRDSCIQIEGTDGQTFPPFINKEKKWSFQTDICRSMSFVFEKEVDIDGIKAYRFTTSAESQWVNRTDNFCFNDELGSLYNEDDDTYDPCIKETEDPEVLDIKNCTIKMDGRDGLQDLHHCFDSPLFVSNPHFFQAEQELENIASGMNPDPELHGLAIDVEPNTGFSIQLHKRVQFNMPLTISDKIDVLNKINEMIFPVMWIDEGADIDEENIKVFKGKLVTPILLVDIAKWGLIALGALMTIGGIFLLC